MNISFNMTRVMNIKPLKAHKKVSTCLPDSFIIPQHTSLSGISATMNEMYCKTTNKYTISVVYDMMRRVSRVEACLFVFSPPYTHPCSSSSP